MKRILATFIFCVYFCTGCASVSSNTHKVSVEEKPISNQQDDVTAVKSVIGAVSGQEINDSDLRDLGKQLKKDEEAKTAVEAISESMVNPGERVKYCPVTGKRYSSKLEKCPIHGVPLEEVAP